MSNLVPYDFSFERAAVRAIEFGGEPWFVHADVCAVLGIAEPRRLLAPLD